MWLYVYLTKQVKDAVQVKSHNSFNNKFPDKKIILQYEMPTTKHKTSFINEPK
jgi:hypothetical protein